MNRAAIFLAPLVLACQGGDPPEGSVAPEPPRPAVATAAPVREAIRVEVARLDQSSARISFRLPGEVEGAREAMLGAALGGFVERVFVREGEEVRRGQTLVRVDSQTHQARLDQALVAERNARRELDRARALGDALAPSQLEAAESLVLAAEAATRLARVGVTRSTITAPFSGVTVAVEVEQGEVAPPGAPLIRLVQLDPVKVTLTVSDRDVVALREGMEALVTTAARAEVFTGRIVRLALAADASSRAFEVEVEVPNAQGRLLPGMIANVEVREEAATSELVVPQDWVVTKLDGLGVFIEDNGVARFRPVALGTVIRDQIVVESGLTAGERVVTTGQRMLVDGDPVLVVREGTCCTDGRVTYEQAR
jgi:membrane fusion protein (multidrug efflux system)